MQVALQKKIIKSEEIAKIVGVSRSTVSRVINNYPNVTPETREKVLEAIRKFNYHPNALARTLAGKATGTIGVFFVMDRKEGDYRSFYHNDFFTSFLEAIISVANARQHYVLVRTITSTNDYQSIEEAFREQRIDGGIMVGTRKRSLEFIDESALNKHLVVIDMDPKDVDPSYFDKQLITILNAKDDQAAGRAVEYLAKRGHRRIGFIKGLENTLSSRTRFDGYRKALKRLGLDYDEGLTLQGDYEISIAKEAMNQAIRENRIASAYVCANDYMAIAAIEALTQAGKKVPEEVSFIGFDGTQTGGLSQPKLTSMAPDYFKMSEKAIEMLENYLNPTPIDMEKVCNFEMTLIERESVVSVDGDL